MSKKLIMLLLILGSLNVTVLYATTVSPMSKEEAIKKATQFVPENSQMLKVEKKGNNYEVKFYNKNTDETYEIEMDSTEQAIKEFKTKIISKKGSNTITLNKEDIKKIVLKAYPNATILDTQLKNEDGVKVYEVKIVNENMTGEIEINPQTGSILERDLERKVNPKAENIKNASKNGFMSIEKVKERTLSKIPQASITEIKLDFEAGRYVYEIEAYKEGYEYELKLDAKTGEGLFVFKELDEWYNESISDKIPVIENAKTSTLEKAKAITLENAKTIALEKVPGSKIIKIEQEEEDGRLIYEVELRKEHLEYNIEIDAMTGKILSMDKDD